MAASLLTRYIFASAWTRLLIFIIFYLLARTTHFIDADFFSVDYIIIECMTQEEDKNANNALACLINTKEALKKQLNDTVANHHQIIKQLNDTSGEYDAHYTRLQCNLADSTNTITKLKEKIKKIELLQQNVDQIKTTQNTYSLKGTEKGPIREAAEKFNKDYFNLHTTYKPVMQFIQDNKIHSIFEQIRINEAEAVKFTTENAFIANAIDKNFVELSKKQEQMEHFLVAQINSEIAESKTSTIREVYESIDDIINNKINEAENRITSQIESRISTVEEHQKSFITNDFLEQLKSFLLNKQEYFQQKNQQALVNLEIRQQASQRALINNLRDSFDRKLGLADSEVLDLKTQNLELQQTVAQQVAETKGQQELIENVRKSFERKINARDVIINELKEEKTQLVRNITDLQQAQAKITQDFTLMKEHFTALKHQNDTLMHFQQLSMQRTNLENSADVKTVISPSRLFPDLK